MTIYRLSVRELDGTWNVIITTQDQVLFDLIVGDIRAAGDTEIATETEER